MANLNLKTYDTYPPLIATLQSGGSAIDLTNATSVTIVLKGNVSGATITGACTIIGSPTNGQVQYAWQTGDTQQADTYQCEFKIVWNSGGIQKVPNSAAGNPTVEIDADLDGSVG